MAAAHPVTNYAGDNSAVAAPFMAVFEAKLPPMSMVTYTLSATTTTAAVGDTTQPSGSTATHPSAGFTVTNGIVSLSFDSFGALRSLRTGSALSTPLAIEPRAYYPHKAVNNCGYRDPQGCQPSGAYIFRPNGTAQPVRAGGTPASFELVGSSTDLVQEVRQVWADWLNVTIRLAKGALTFELLVTAGPLPMYRPHPMLNGTELIMHMTSGVASNASLWTDSNGREMLHRVRDYRPTWTLNQTEHAAGNYYPVTTAAFIRDEHTQLTLLIDSAQGVASLADGELEVMLHRRLLQDDNRGVQEPLNETESSKPYYAFASAARASAGKSLAADGKRQVDGGGLVSPLTDGNGVGLGLWHSGGQHLGRGLIVRARYVLSLATPASAAAIWRPSMDAIYAPPQLFFTHGKMGAAESTHGGLVGAPASFLRTPLPPNLQIITLQLMASGQILLRLAHQFGIGEDATLSKPASVDLARIFTHAALPVASAVEMTLTANQPKSHLRRRRAAMAATARAARGTTDGADADDVGSAWLAAWPTEDSPVSEARTVHPWRSGPPFEWDASTVVTLGPLEIKTFILTLS